MNGEPERPAPGEPSVGLLARAREQLSLPRVQAILGILAALHLDRRRALRLPAPQPDPGPPLG